MLQFTNKNELTTNASYEITYLLAKHIKPFSDVELVKSCVVMFCFVIFPNLMKYVTKFQICSYLILHVFVVSNHLEIKYLIQ